MLKYFHRNVLELESPFLLAHGCNALGKMGAGVALGIKNKWPRCYTEYKRQLDTGIVELGGVAFHQIDTVSWVANCITQAKTGSGLQVDYDAIHDSFEEVMLFARHNGYDHVDTVPIGAGLGGGDWGIISETLHDLSEKYKIDIHVSAFDKPTYDKVKKYVY